MVPPDVLQVTAGLLDPFRVAVNCCWCPESSEMARGETRRPVLGTGVLLPDATVPDSNIETIHVDHTGSR